MTSRALPTADVSGFVCGLGFLTVHSRRPAPHPEGARSRHHGNNHNGFDGNRLAGLRLGTHVGIQQLSNTAETMYTVRGNSIRVGPEAKRLHPSYSAK